MENEKKQSRDHWLHLRLTEKEKLQIHKSFLKTTQRKLSDYARKILLGKPMIASYRNASIDDLMNELIKLRKDLNGLANNFNQTVHKLHTLDHGLSLESLLKHYEKERKILFEKVEEMRKMTNKLGAEWLR
ncbi:plasmid mobilization relaxosome protein MobC [Pedobacter sp. SD-b]|uniref:Plasmid mobilization relaxosome protein MobC n=1 Tax=Pedobacter segetis TaxID=2793069 RepID=A0ABS1BN14_9SPHI|nr:plasmid mobilization relaxosome protein MobC [Pedobacter segetis]MBK0383589.1 plasmid mobilization relaxosome protein MobC [Pedobacter segetis]